MLLLLLQLFFCYSDATTTVDIGATAANVGPVQFIAVDKALDGGVVVLSMPACLSYLLR